MTNNAIKEIRKIEENATQKVINAQAEAKYRVEQTILEIEKSKADAEQKFKEIYNARIATTTEQADRLLAEKKAEAQAEANKIELHAESKMQSAVDIIIEEIKSVWQ